MGCPANGSFHIRVGGFDNNRHKTQAHLPLRLDRVRSTGSNCQFASGSMPTVAADHVAVQIARALNGETTIITLKVSATA